MQWSGQKEFGGSSEIPFNVDGAAAGMLKTHGPLSFLKVVDSFCPSVWKYQYY